MTVQQFHLQVCTEQKCDTLGYEQDMFKNACNNTNQNNPTQEEPEMSINSTMENINDAVLFHDLCLDFTEIFTLCQYVGMHIQNMHTFSMDVMLQLKHLFKSKQIYRRNI